jgi:hypothetical protein
MSEHAIFSPSSSVRWLACPYSVDPDNPPPEQDTEYTAKGTAMHKRGEQHLKGGTDPREDKLPVPWELNGRKALLEPDDWQPHVVPYVEGVRRIKAERAAEVGSAGKALLLVECKVTINGIYCWGTCDAAILTYHGTSLVALDIVDLKTGSGHIVDPRSSQFLLYAAGFCNKYGIPVSIRLHRSQAAASKPWETAEVGPADILDIIGRTQHAIGQGISHYHENAATEENTNAECCWCPRYKSGTCPAHNVKALRALEASDVDLSKLELLLPTPVEIAAKDEGKTLKWWLDNMDALTAWMKSMREYATGELMAQRLDLPGYAIVKAKTHRRWRKDMAKAELAQRLLEVADMLDHTAFDPWEKDLVSFTKVEKLLGAGTVDNLTEKPDGAPTLVRSERVENRETANPLKALEADIV